MVRRAAMGAIALLCISLSCQVGDDASTGDDAEPTASNEVPPINTEPVPPKGFIGEVQASMPLTLDEVRAIEEAAALNAARNPADQDPSLRGFPVAGASR
jgi:hypothetical protein